MKFKRGDRVIQRGNVYGVGTIVEVCIRGSRQNTACKK